MWPKIVFSRCSLLSLLITFAPSRNSKFQKIFWADFWCTIFLSQFGLKLPHFKAKKSFWKIFSIVMFVYQSLCKISFWFNFSKVTCEFCQEKYLQNYGWGTKTDFFYPRLPEMVSYNLFYWKLSDLHLVLEDFNKKRIV